MKLYDWLTLECVYCSSVNHIFLSGEYPAWECYCCLNSHWINDECKFRYALEKGIDIYEADFMLKNNQVKVLHGEIHE